MKKLRTSKKMMALAIVPGVMASFALVIAMWMVVQFNIAVAIVIALALSAFYFLIVYFISDKGISFDEEKFYVKGDREYFYHEIDEVRVKISDYDCRRYKAIVVDGEEVCIFDDLYSNAKEFKAILEKHGFRIKSDNRILDP